MSRCISRSRTALRSLRALAALVLATITFALPAAAQQQPVSLAEQLDRFRLALDRIETTLKRETLPVQALYDLSQTLNPLRTELRAAIGDLEPRLAQAEAGLKQLGRRPRVALRPRARPSPPSACVSTRSLAMSTPP